MLFSTFPQPPVVYFPKPRLSHHYWQPRCGNFRLEWEKLQNLGFWVLACPALGSVVAMPLSVHARLAEKQTPPQLPLAHRVENNNPSRRNATQPNPERVIFVPRSTNPNDQLNPARRVLPRRRRRRRRSRPPRRRRMTTTSTPRPTPSRTPTPRKRRGTGARRGPASAARAGTGETIRYETGRDEMRLYEAGMDEGLAGELEGWRAGRVLVRAGGAPTVQSGLSAELAPPLSYLASSSWAWCVLPTRNSSSRSRSRVDFFFPGHEGRSTFSCAETRARVSRSSWPSCTRSVNGVVEAAILQSLSYGFCFFSSFPHFWCSV